MAALKNLPFSTGLTILLIFFVNVVDGANIPTEKLDLIVSSTVKPNEPSASSEAEKEDGAPSVPKIYEMRVDTNVSNRFASTLITSKVKNLSKKAQEATFTVVLPETGYISSFVMEIDGKSYEAYVKEKEEAKKIYEQAVQTGQAAGHVSVSARDSNRFTVSVNVESQSKAIFRLTYEELLQRRNERYELVLNLNPGQPVKDLQVQVNINETRPLKFVKTPPLRSGNDIAKVDDDLLDPAAIIDIVNSTTATIKFDPDIEKQKQYGGNLGGDKEQGLSGQFVVQYDVERDPQGGEVLVKDGYFVHFFAPTDKPALSKQVVFILDTSGSMGGRRIEQLKEAMTSILSELKKEDIFNIVEFGSDVKVWNVDNGEVQYSDGEVFERWYTPGTISTTTEEIVKEKPELPPAYEASEENVMKAKQVVDKLRANGGTNMQLGLEIGLKLVKKNKDENEKSKHQPIIIFLTDGEPTVGETDTNNIIKNIQKDNSGESQSPIFSLSFGNGADRDFLQKISLRNLGFARHIYEAADASLQLQEFYKQISSPLLSDVNFKYVSKVKKLTRTHFPIFFGGSELVVAGEIDDKEFLPTPVTCIGPLGPIELIPKIENPIGALERLWAYLTVKQILEDRDAADNKTELTKKALDLALKYSFVTSVSSLVVVKPNGTKGDEVNTEDASKTPSRDNPYFQTLAIGGASGSVFAAYAPAALPSPGAVDIRVDVEESDPISSPVPEARPTLHSKTTSVLPLSSTSTENPTISTIDDPYEILNKALPWLSSILSPNGTLSTPEGGYQLGVNKDDFLTNPECPKTPSINGTSTEGVCTPLEDCLHVYSALTEVKDFVDHICFVDNKIAGICCPKISQ